MIRQPVDSRNFQGIEESDATESLNWLNAAILNGNYENFAPERISDVILLNGYRVKVPGNYARNVDLRANCVPESFPATRVFGGNTALQALAGGSRTLSRMTEGLNMAVVGSLESVDKSSKVKPDAISRLTMVVNEYALDESITIQPRAVAMAKQFLKVLPDGISPPEFSIEPDGSISMDWIAARNRVFSISVGTDDRFACAWLDGTNKGHCVENFNGREIPKRIIDGIKAILTGGYATFRAT